MATATEVKRWDGTVVSNGAHSTKVLYRLDPPYLPVYGDAVEYVVASSVDYAFDTGSPETLVFAADENGEVSDWTDLAVVHGEEDHEQAISNLGYEVAQAVAQEG